MKKRLTPSEKKLLSYKKDCRNNYGENDKSSRKAIRKRKALVNRSYRRRVKQFLNTFEDSDEVESKTKTIRRQNWKKAADVPLSEYIDFKLTRELAIILNGLNALPEKDFIENYFELGKTRIEARKVFKVLNSFIVAPTSTELNFSSETLKNILKTIKRMV